MIKTVTAMSRDRAAAFDPKSLGTHTAMLSISSLHTGQAEFSSEYDKILRTAFNLVPGSFRFDNDGGPSAETIGRMLDFIQELDADPIEYDLVVHCGEGRFRSIAVASFVNLHYRAKAFVAEPGFSLAGGSVSLSKDLRRERARRKTEQAAITPPA